MIHYYTHLPRREQAPRGKYWPKTAATLDTPPPMLYNGVGTEDSRSREPETKPPVAANYREPFLSVLAVVHGYHETCDSNQDRQQFNVRHAITSHLIYSAGALPGTLPDHYPAL